MKKIIYLVFLLFICRNAQSDDTLRVYFGTFDFAPYSDSSPSDVLSTVNAAILGQLLDYNKNFELEPGLLQSWKWNYEKKYYDLVLKPNLYFHNGRKANARDLEFTLLRGFFSKRKSFYNIYLGNILGSNKIRPGTAFKSGQVAGVKIIDNSTVRVFLKDPNPTFLFSLARPYFSLVPREALASDLLTWNDYPIGAGPYKVVTAFRDGILRLQNVDRSAKFRFVELFSKVDFSIAYDLSFQPNVVPANYEKSLSPIFPFTVWGIFFSNINPLGQNKQYRKAFKYIFNRRAINQYTPDTQPSYELLPHHYWGRANLSENFDPSKARQILLPFRALIRPVKIPVYGGKEISETRKRRLSVLRDQLRVVGINVSFYPSTEKILTQKTALEAPFTIIGTVANMIDPLLMFASFRKQSAYQFEGVQNDEYFEELYNRTSRELVEAKKIEALRTLSNYVSEAPFVVPVSEEKDPIFYNSNTVSSLGEQTRAGIVYLNRVVPKNRLR